MSITENHIFLFILDAVRKDHLSLYGYPRKTSPNIDKLAKQADVYQWAFAPSSYTLASVPSILAGKYPIYLSNYLINRNFEKLDFEILNIFKQRGYFTAMFSTNTLFCFSESNLHKFFDYFYDGIKNEKIINNKNFYYQDAENVIKNVKKILSKNKYKKNFFIIHLMEAHGPKNTKIHPKFKNDVFYKKDLRKISKLILGPVDNIPRSSLIHHLRIPFYQLKNLKINKENEIEDYNNKVKDYVGIYDSSIKKLDDELGKFFSFLKKNKIFHSSQIIITSDHGELMGEKNIFLSHGLCLSPYLVNIPLIIKNPYQKNKMEKNKPLSLVDLIPNIILKIKKNFSPIYCFHPKGVGLVSRNKYITLYNGDYSPYEKLYENLLPSDGRYKKQMSLPQILIANYKNLIIDLEVEIYQFNRNKIKALRKASVDETTFEECLFLILKCFKQTFNLLNQQLKQYFACNKEKSNLIKNIEELKKENQSLKNDLLKIRNSKTYKIWQFYCSLKKKFLNFLKFLNE